MSIMQVLLSREGLSPEGSVVVSEDTLAAVEASDVEADVVETDIEAVAEANEEATEVEQGVEEVAEAVTAMEAIMERIVAATADGSKLTPREIGFISNEAHAVYRSIGIRAIPVLATESIDAGNNATLALEGLADIASKLLNGLASALSKIGAAVSKFWVNTFTAYGRIRVRASKLKAKLEALNGDTVGTVEFDKEFDGFEKMSAKFITPSKTILVDYQNDLVNYIKKGCEGEAPSLQRVKNALKALPYNPTVIRVMNKYDLFEADTTAGKGEVKFASKAALIKHMDDTIALCDLVQRSKLGWIKTVQTFETLVTKLTKAMSGIAVGSAAASSSTTIGRYLNVGTGGEMSKEINRIRNVIGAAMRAPRDFIGYELHCVNISLNLTARAIKAASAA